MRPISETPDYSGSQRTPVFYMTGALSFLPLATAAKEKCVIMGLIGGSAMKLLKKLGSFLSTLNTAPVFGYSSKCRRSSNSVWFGYGRTVKIMLQFLK